MRWKIIFVNGAIVMVLAVLTYFLLSASLMEVVANRGEQKRELTRALRAAESQLVLDGLRVERWLTQKAASEPVRSVYRGGTAAARSGWATNAANRLRDEAAADPEFSRMAPSLVLFVDERGVGIGRNGSALMRGDQLAASYPSLAKVLESGTTQSDVWIHRQRQEQMLVSYGPVRDDEGRIRGAVVLGTPLNDERLARTSELTSGHALAFLHLREAEVSVVAAFGPKSQSAREDAVTRAARQALEGSSLVYVPDVLDGRLYGALRVSGGSTSVLVASVPASRVGSVAGLLWPVFAVAALGLGLVIVSGVLLGNYISRPVAELEEGLLMVISGNQNVRFELEHEELGGLATRINTLLNTLLGVSEEASDGPTREPKPASGQQVNEALATADGSASKMNYDVAVIEALAAAPAEQYYSELYEAYIRAKRQIGDPVDHISLEAFRERITTNEQEMLARHGQPVRYRAELKDGAVVLVAVPLPALAG